eukprot:3555809-Karenia_brevis.AAC.1
MLSNSRQKQMRHSAELTKCKKTQTRLWQTYLPRSPKQKKQPPTHLPMITLHRIPVKKSPPAPSKLAP